MFEAQNKGEKNEEGRGQKRDLGREDRMEGKQTKDIRKNVMI